MWSHCLMLYTGTTCQYAGSILVKLDPRLLSSTLLAWPKATIKRPRSNTPRQICFPLSSSYIALLDDLLTCNEILNAIKFVDQCYFYCDYCMLAIYSINNPTRFQLHVSKHEPQVTMLLQPLHYICWTKRNFYWGFKMSQLQTT